MHLRGIHAPALCRRHFQHQPAGRATFAHRLQEMPRAARAVRVLVAVAGFVAGRLHHLHPRPIGIKLFGHHHRQAGAHAGAHFPAMRHNGHHAAGIDRDEHMRVVHRAIRHAGGAGFVNLMHVGGTRAAGQQACHHHQATAEHGAFQQATAADILYHMCWRNICHVTPPSRPAAPRWRFADNSRSGRYCRSWHR